MRNVYGRPVKFIHHFFANIKRGEIWAEITLIQMSGYFFLQA